MKILFTADLHYRPGWFGCFEDEAHKYALISIAGDLLDMFSKAPCGGSAGPGKSFFTTACGKDAGGGLFGQSRCG
ncbi:MAG: hypothetical protein JO025_22040 [Verrucomicrobia bacterium]|nr:hypothetical protein [Verrucomicrobiota bacterium]